MNEKFKKRAFNKCKHEQVTNVEYKKKKTTQMCQIEIRKSKTHLKKKIIILHVKGKIEGFHVHSGKKKVWRKCGSTDRGRRDNLVMEDKENSVSTTFSFQSLWAKSVGFEEEKQQTMSKQ